jgi:hypothetical protein
MPKPEVPKLAGDGVVGEGDDNHSMDWACRRLVHGLCGSCQVGGAIRLEAIIEGGTIRVGA